MKRYIKILLLLLLPFISFAQTISETTSFENAVLLAQQVNKPLLLIVKIPASSNSRMPRNLIPSNDVVRKMKSDFVVFETDRTDKAIANLLAAYKIQRFPAFLFMHDGTDVFYSDSGYSTGEAKYLSMLKKAVSLRDSESLSALEKTYNNDKTNNTQLTKLIETRFGRGLTDNAELIEQFAKNLKLGDLNNYQTVLFMLKAGPYADGMAYKLAYTNRKITDSIYKTESAALRSAMNAAIISNTLASAIRKKSIVQARSAADFARRITRSNYQRANQQYSYNMLSYYNAVSDTSNYFKEAINYYDTYYMALSADSIEKIELKKRNQMLATQTKLNKSRNIVSKEKMDSIIRANPNVRRDTAIVSGKSSNSFATSLNNVAWKFYKTGTKNINHLSKAMIWSRRSIELEPLAGYYDTLAHILYMMGYHDEAIKTQGEAISRAKDESRSFADMKVELQKMKERSL